MKVFSRLLLLLSFIFINHFNNTTTLLRLREGKRKADLHIDNEKDFALGFAYGAIKATLNGTFLKLKSRPPNLEETREADMIIYNIIDELRDAIFRSG
jgi:hypothetical protein